jgi:uncharacterized membrane protein (UPF0136 family)
MADLLLLIVGATAVPLYPVAVLLMLQGQGGLLKAIAFVGGNVAVRLAQGVFFGLVFGTTMAASSEDGQRLGVSMLLLIVGILLLITPLRNGRRRTPMRRPNG